MPTNIQSQKADQCWTGTGGESGRRKGLKRHEKNLRMRGVFITLFVVTVSQVYTYVSILYIHIYSICNYMSINVFKKIEKLWLLNIRHLTFSQDWVKSETSRQKNGQFLLPGTTFQFSNANWNFGKHILAVKRLTLPIIFPVRLGMALMNVIFW